LESTTVLLLNESWTRPREDDAVVSYHRTRRSRSALAYGSRSTATAQKTSTGSYTTSGDATLQQNAVTADKPWLLAESGDPRTRRSE
jgi:hypothetical protein